MTNRDSVKRIGIFGWGVVAPKSPNVEAFARNLESNETWLEPFEGFGPNNFLFGNPDFDLHDYAGWISERFPPARFKQIERKMGMPTQYAIGAFIQALQQNIGLEQVLHELGTKAHIYVGTGLGDLNTVYAESVNLQRGQRTWDRFWAHPERNVALQEYLNQGSPKSEAQNSDVPDDPETAAEFDREIAEEKWWSYWSARSSLLREYLRELQEIEALKLEGAVETNKGNLLRRKQTLGIKLQAKYGAPDAPWTTVSANVLWNIHNTPASQISMLGQIHGMTFAPVAACSTFGYSLKLAVQAIRTGQATAVVLGAADPCPGALSVGSFYKARVISAAPEVSKPLTDMRGTHCSGGAAVWIVGDAEFMQERGFKPLGMEILGVGVTADADHIITPSPEGPTLAVREALADAGVDAKEIGTWDLHATATPGDFLEVRTARQIISDQVLITARKGTFGHGMGVCGGWELLAQHLGYEKGCLFPSPASEAEVNPEIAALHDRFVLDKAEEWPDGVAGKLSMGIGGINACVLSRPWEN